MVIYSNANPFGHFSALCPFITHEDSPRKKPESLVWMDIFYKETSPPHCPTSHPVYTLYQNFPHLSLVYILIVCVVPSVWEIILELFLPASSFLSFKFHINWHLLQEAHPNAFYPLLLTLQWDRCPSPIAVNSLTTALSVSLCLCSYQEHIPGCLLQSCFLIFFSLSPNSLLDTW